MEASTFPLSASTLAKGSWHRTTRTSSRCARLVRISWPPHPPVPSSPRWYLIKMRSCCRLQCVGSHDDAAGEQCVRHVSFTRLLSECNVRVVRDPQVSALPLAAVSLAL